jgi:hypothetical protein
MVALAMLAAGLGAVQGTRQEPVIRLLQGPIATPSLNPLPLGRGTRQGPGRLGINATEPVASLTLRIPPTTTGELIGGDQAVADLTPAGRVAPFLALTSDPRRGLVLTADFDGRLRCYSESLQLLGTRHLPGVAYQLALDSSRGLLYAAVAARPAVHLGALGDRERALGDLHVYDVKRLLESGPGIESALVPLHELPLGGHVRALLLSRGGEHLYYLSHGGREPHVGRVVTADWRRDGMYPVRGGVIAGLSQAPDSGLLAGVWGGQLFVLDADPGRWEELPKKTVQLGITIDAFVMGTRGRLFLVEKRSESGPNGPQTFVTVVDVRTWQVQQRYSLPLTGRSYAAVAPGGDRLYVCTSAVLNGHLYALDLGSKETDSVRLAGQARRDRDRLLRGGLFLGPHGKVLFTGNGYAFRTLGGA